MSAESNRGPDARSAAPMPATAAFEDLRTLAELDPPAAAADADPIARLQQELVDKIRSAEFQPFVDVMLERTGALLRKIVRAPVPFWASALAIAAAILVVSLAISAALGEFNDSFGMARIPSEFALAGLVFVGTLILKMEMDEVYTVCSAQLVYHIESVDDLRDLDSWFGLISKRHGLVLGAVAGGVITGALAAGYASTLRGEFIGIGPALLDIGVNILALIGIYYIFCFVNLAHRMGGYHFRMFSLDPHKSEVVYHLSSMFFSYVRAIAIFMGAVTLVLGYFAVIDSSVAGILLVVGWGPIVIAFFLSESTLARIISNVKWRILESIQHELELLRKDRAITDSDYLDDSERLLALHDRIWATPNHALDMTAILSFINTLLLPLISFAVTQLPTMIPWPIQ